MITLNDNITLDDITQLYRLILKVKTVEYNVNLSAAHINLIIDFYRLGINQDSYQYHIERSRTEKDMFKSKATIDNARTYLKKHGILTDDKEVSPLYLPPLNDTEILLNIKVKYDQRH
jgi:uncharacterized protein (UPF0276 family)